MDSGSTSTPWRCGTSGTSTSPSPLRTARRRRTSRAPSRGACKTWRSAYFGCTDFDLGTQAALQIYASRWGCETDNVYLKTRLGLGDFRVRPYAAVDKYVAVVHLTWACVQWRFLHERLAQIRTPADIIRRYRDEHACDWLTGACQGAIATGDIETVLQRFLRLNA